MHEFMRRILNMLLYRKKNKIANLAYDYDAGE